MPAPCPWQTTVPLGQLYIWGNRLESGHFTFPSRMVNFHDPVKIARDFCAYPSPPGSGSWTQSTCRFFYSVTREALAYRGWSVHVGLPC
jgi:hypothetical protein